MNGKRSVRKSLYVVRHIRTGQEGGKRKCQRQVVPPHRLCLEFVLGQLMQIAVGVVMLMLGWTATAPAAESVDFRDAAAKAIGATVSVESRAETAKVPILGNMPEVGRLFVAPQGTTQPAAAQRDHWMTLAGIKSIRVDLGQAEKQPRAANANTGEAAAGKGGAEQKDGTYSLAFTADGTLLAGPGQELTLRSGTIVSADGLIVTSDLPAKVEHLEVTLADGRKLEAKLMVRDERFQLSLLKVEAENLVALDPADTAAAAGQPVMSCACAEGTARVVSSGIVSAAGRIVGNRLPPLIQTDVQPGEAGAGGPLVDAEGRLVGIILSRETAGSAGVTFAVPAEHVRALLTTARGEQTVVIERPQLGVQLEGDTAVVEEVVPDSPAAKGGIEKGDMIVEVAGAPVATAQDVVAGIVQQQPDAEVQIKVRRGDEVIPLEVVLGRREEKPAEAPTLPQGQSPGFEYRLETIQPGMIFYDRSKSLQAPIFPRGTVSDTPWTLPFVTNGQVGAIRVWVDPQQQEASSGEVVKRLEEMIKNYEKSDEAKPLLEELQAIVDRQNQRRAQDHRVEELIQQVDTLRQTVESLGKQLDALSKTLKAQGE